MGEDDIPEKDEKSSDLKERLTKAKPRRIAGTAGLALLLLLVGFLVRPAIHDVVYSIIFKSPYLIQWSAIGGIFVLGAIFTDDEFRSYSFLVIAGFFIVVMGLIVGPYFGSVQTKKHLSNEVLEEKTDIDELPEVDSDNPRILPQSVGKEYAENKLQLPKHKLGSGDITFLDGTPHWSFPLKPDGTWNTFNENQRGGAFVNMSTHESDVKMLDNQEFKWGVGQVLSENYEWHLLQKKYFAEYKDPFLVKHEDEMYLAVPYIQHDIEYNIGLPPQPYSVPKFGGVALMSGDGEIQMLSPEQAKESEILEGQRYYPYSLAKYRIKSANLRNGLINTFTSHEDMFKVSKVPGEDNSQPFTVKTGDGIKYFLATEPYGEASGIYQIWVIDGQTGEISLKSFENTTLLGPKKASNYVEKDEPKINWDNMSPSEPTPTVRDGTLYWQIKVVPSSSSGVSYTAFVNSKTGDVLEYTNDKQVYGFIKGEIEKGGDLGDGRDQKGGVDEDSEGMVVVILDENGNPVRRVEVGENQSIRIEKGEGNTTSP